MDAAHYILLFLCGILCQGTCTLSEDNNEKSSDILIRQRRIAGGSRRRPEESPHIVSILVNGNFHCPLTLLTTDVAITSADCVQNMNRRMTKIQTSTSVGDHPHDIVRVILMDPHYNSSHPTVNNLALVKFSPPINLSFSRNRPVRLFNGNLASQDIRFEVFNWGRPLGLGDRRICSIHLRSLPIRLISIDYCRSILPGIIGAGNLCAYAEVAGEHCHDKDNGAPLLAEGQLIGIFVFHGHVYNVNPEVFMNLLDHNIRRWIHAHVPSLNLF